MIKSEIIRVRYRKDDNTLSRPHKVKKVTYENGDTTYTTMNQNRKIDPDSFVTEWEDTRKVPIHKVYIKQDDEVEIIRVRFLGTAGKYNRPIKIAKITKETGEIEYCHLPIGCSKRIESSEFISYWRKGPTPVSSPKKLNKPRSYSSKDISRLVKKKLAESRDEAKKLLDEYKYVSNIPGYTNKSNTENKIAHQLGTSVKGKGISLTSLGFQHISKTKPNLRKMFKARIDKKYTFLKQSLGKKEITPQQFSVLQNHFIPEEYRSTTNISRRIRRHPERDRVQIQARMKDEGTNVKLPLGTKNGLTSPASS